MAEVSHPPVRLAVTGMTCAGCATAVERVLKRVPGVTKVAVDLQGETAVVEGTAPPSTLIGAAEAAGYGAREDA
jgi:Cu+-exporting ATPase